MDIIKKNKIYFFIFLLIFIISILSGCAGMAASAEEYYSIGMAYFDLGKFDEAEKWLNRAKQADKTFSASQYNLGRLAFEQKRYDEAVKHFEGLLKRDPDNILALRAAAYTRIRLGNIEIAQKHYSKLLTLIPESADDGYNHALVLFAMERYSEAEEVLQKYPFAMQDNKDVQLLFARSQGKQNKAEAIDSFASWLAVNSNFKARYEYALVLEYHEFYARAIEELKQAVKESNATSTDPKQNEIQFALARVTLIAENESDQGITEMQKAVDQGFDNITAIEELTQNSLIRSSNITRLQNIIDNMYRKIAEAEQAAAKKTTDEQEALEQEQKTGDEAENLETNPESGTE